MSNGQPRCVHGTTRSLGPTDVKCMKCRAERLEVAAMILSGILSNSNLCSGDTDAFYGHEYQALLIADALIAKVDK